MMSFIDKPSPIEIDIKLHADNKIDLSLPSAGSLVWAGFQIGTGFLLALLLAVCVVQLMQRVFV